MCVIRWHEHHNCQCQVVTQIELCDGFKQKNPNMVSNFFPIVFMKELRNSTEFFRQRLDDIEYTTANSTIVMAGLAFPCSSHAEITKVDELAQICPFCDNKDVQHQLEQLMEKKVFAVKQEMGRKMDEAESKGKEN